MTEALLLRADIGLADGGHDISGRPGLVLHDPLRHRFFWLPARLRGMVEALQQGLPVEGEDAESLGLFLKQSRLLHISNGTAKELQDEWARGQQSVFSTVLHNYISFRIPLVRPEPFLDATLAAVRVLASRAVAVLLAAIAVLGIYLTLQQWDSFVAMFVSSFTLAGAVTVAATLMVLKVFHELGHAYVARHFGCRVPSMGVTFMLLAPMLYTDASDAWRLSSRRQRFLIGAAGVLVEFGIAAVALLLWALLPDGTSRGVAFFVAVTALGMSLMVNLSPFMRFDGYHMLADALGMHSLGPRSFALANWRLREMLFKPDDAPPEFFSPGLRRVLVGFAMATWLYRLTLFAGIAWLLYVSLPKALGLPLALVEIWFFVLKPVVKELRSWFGGGMRLMWATVRARFTQLVFAGFVVLGFLPLDRHVHVPAVLLPAGEARVFAPEPAQVIRVVARPGDMVQPGDVLAQLMVADIGHLQRQAQLRLEIADSRLSRIAADARERAEVMVLQRMKRTALAELDGLRERGLLLTLRAPMAGKVAGDSLPLHAGQWVGADEMLFLVSGQGGTKLLGLLPEREVERISSEATLRFVPADGVGAALDGKLHTIGLPGGEGMAASYLSSRFGGPVAVEQSEGRERMMVGHLPLLADIEGPAPAQVRTGTAVFQASPQSLFSFLLQRLATVTLREAGF